MPGAAFVAYHCLLPLDQALEIRDRDRRLPDGAGLRGDGPTVYARSRSQTVASFRALACSNRWPGSQLVTYPQTAEAATE